MRILMTLLCFVWLFSGQAMAAVNINSASQSELDTLPGIGPSKAAAIVEYRNANGPFTTVNQLDNVPGIGPATLTNLIPLVTVGDGSTTAPAGSSNGGGSSSNTGNLIDINSASQSELDALPGIGASKAAAIIEYRSANGPFASCAELDDVSGIGPATVSGLEGNCTAVQP